MLCDAMFCSPAWVGHVRSRRVWWMKPPAIAFSASRFNRGRGRLARSGRIPLAKQCRHPRRWRVRPASGSGFGSAALDFSPPDFISIPIGPWRLSDRRSRPGKIETGADIAARIRTVPPVAEGRRGSQSGAIDGVGRYPLRPPGRPVPRAIEPVGLFRPPSRVPPCRSTASVLPGARCGRTRHKQNHQNHGIGRRWLFFGIDICAGRVAARCRPDSYQRRIARLTRNPAGTGESGGRRGPGLGTGKHALRAGQSQLVVVSEIRLRLRSPDLVFVDEGAGLAAAATGRPGSTAGVHRLSVSPHGSVQTACGWNSTSATIGECARLRQPRRIGWILPGRLRASGNHGGGRRVANPDRFWPDPLLDKTASADGCWTIGHRTRGSRG